MLCFAVRITGLQKFWEISEILDFLTYREKVNINFVSIANMLSDITILIKTFERPEYLDRLIKSIKLYYPNIKIIVADDSRNPIVRNDVEYHG